MTVYIKQGSAFIPTSEKNLDVHDVLPVGNYLIKWDDYNKRFFFEGVDSFNLTNKIYGDTTKNADRIANTFEDRPSSTGVMLCGEKGSGKTLLAKILSQKFNEKGYPCFLINTPLCGDGFNKLIQDITQPCMVMFDEFEKTYDKDDQEAVLTLLDGVFPSKKLFVITCNDKYKIDINMRNRPGRIFYLIDYEGIDVEFVREYCEDNLLNKSHTSTVCRLSSLFNAFNFDMLKALVEEMNRYNETPQDALKLLNAKPHKDEYGAYDITVLVDGEALRRFWPDEKHGNPLADPNLHINYRRKVSKEDMENPLCDEDDEDGDDETSVQLRAENLIELGKEDGVFVFKVENVEVRFSRRKESFSTIRYLDA